MDERLLAASGLLKEAPLQFAHAVDVPFGGVLCALPALLVTGLVRHCRKFFSLAGGFYPLESFFVVLAFTALARLRSLEALRYQPPGEWGKLLGLDRIPEVTTMRRKLDELAGGAAEWGAALVKDWMEDQAQSPGVYYADGHVRVYHGGLTKLPRRHVARAKLRLRGTTDYWVNAFDGAPFFVVTCPVDPGLISVLCEQIVPRLLETAPGQPSKEQLAADPLLHRLTMVFDREGYSPAAFARLKALRVACLCYHKFPGEDWPLEQFSPREIIRPNGKKCTLLVAERGTCLSNQLWVRELRRLDDNAHQVSILSTDYRSDLSRLVPEMSARWNQEAYFKYMLENFALDHLAEHGVTALPDTTRVVNPAWRRLDHDVRRTRALFVRQQAKFTALTLSPAPQPAEIRDWEEAKGQLALALTTQQQALQTLVAQRKQTPRHVALATLPKDEQFGQLRGERKILVDTVKLIAYRAETAMACALREHLARSDDVRALLRELFTTTADLLPDLAAKTLTVRVHPLASRCHDQAIAALCAELNDTETFFPGTDLRLVYEILGSG